MAPLHALVVALAVAGLAGLQEPGQARAPRIEVRAPDELAPQAERLDRFDRARLTAVMRLVGLQEPGPAIPVFLAPEGGPVAQQTPAWITGFASAQGVVLFPARAPSYPHDSLEELLQHEVAHVLISRAAGGRPVPRWFHEGIALAAERTWSLGDRASFAIDVAFGGTVSADSLDRLFREGPGPARRAYRVSGMLVQDLLKVHGPDFPARVLAGVRGGSTFEEAFRASAGAGVDEAVEAFWDRRLWATVLPWLTSPAALWVLMTLLALAAFVAVRLRRARRRWEDDELGPAAGSQPQ